MGGSREGYNLFKSSGRYCFWRDVKRGRLNSYVWGDTFGPVWCFLLRSHHLYDANAGGFPPEMACKRCRSYIKVPKP